MTDTNDMQEAEGHPMDVAATEAIAQGWCEPETSSHEMDAVLAMAIAKPVSRLLRNWYDTAAQHCRNEEYYRGLVQEIGLLLGDEAFVSDDGSVQQDVLCAKVPELVRARLSLRATLESVLAASASSLNPDDFTEFERIMNVLVETRRLGETIAVA